MATVTIEYNARNSIARKMMEVIMAMDTVFTVKTPVKTQNTNFTRQAINDVESGNVTTCSSYEDYLKKTADYA